MDSGIPYHYNNGSPYTWKDGLCIETWPRFHLPVLHQWQQKWWSKLEQGVYLFTPQPSGLEGYCHTGKGGWLSDFMERTSLKPLNGFSLFKVLWNCLDLKLCNIMVICPIWYQINVLRPYFQKFRPEQNSPHLETSLSCAHLGRRVLSCPAASVHLSGLPSLPLYSPQYCHGFCSYSVQPKTLVGAWTLFLITLTDLHLGL